MKNQKYRHHHNNSKETRRNNDKIDISNTHIHDRIFSCAGADTSVKRGVVKLVLWPQSSQWNYSVMQVWHDLDHWLYKTIIVVQL
jgi:hypothetical protein